MSLTFMWIYHFFLTTHIYPYKIVLTKVVILCDSRFIGTESGKSLSYDDERENLVGWEGRGATKGMKEKKWGVG